MIRNIHSWQSAPIYREGQGTLAEQLVRARLSRNLLDSAGSEPIAAWDDGAWIDPFAFLEMEQAVACLHTIRARHGTVFIHGDYDADGLTASAILHRFLTAQGLPVEVYIPNRLEEGYGLSMQGVQAAIDKGVDLVITVDCGTNSLEEFQALREAGIRTILTDHHQLLGALPEADARLNPSCPQLGYPEAVLSGAGVALKLVQALCVVWNLGEQWRDCLDLAAVGTVADLMLLQGENRCLVREGLQCLRNHPSPGLQALLENLRVDSHRVTEEQIGYQIAPRINAAGRMGNIDPAWTLLTTQEFSVGRLAARDLEELNTRRRNLVDASLQQAKQQIHAHPEWLQVPILVVAHPDWSPGILGLIASALVQAYARPTVALGGLNLTGEEGLYTGSARTFGDFELLEALQRDRDLFVSCGGHQSAAGLRISPENLSLWRAHLAQQPIEEERKRELPCDLELTDLSPLYEQSILELQELGPYGKGWEPPILACTHLRVYSCQAIGANGIHWRLILEDVRGKRLTAVWFRGVQSAPWLQSGSRVRVCGRPEIYVWAGRKNMQFRIEDLQEESRLLEYRGLPASWKRAEPTMLGQRLGQIFQVFENQMEEGGFAASLEWIARALAENTGFLLSQDAVKHLIQLFSESAILGASFYQAGGQEFCCLQQRKETERKRLSTLPSWDRIWDQEERDVS